MALLRESKVTIKNPLFIKVFLETMSYRNYWPEWLQQKKLEWLFSSENAHFLYKIDVLHWLMTWAHSF